MFHRIHVYDLVEAAGRWYRPRVYGSEQPDGSWDGWLVFFPLNGEPAIATDRETSQRTYRALADWAAGLGPVYLHGALARALALAEQPPLIAQLGRAEYEALEDAARLETAAGIERVAAVVDETAAAAAREDAERIRRERLASEAALAATEEAAATVQAAAHEEAAQVARETAAAAADRRRRAKVATVKGTRSKSRRGKAK